MKNTPESIALSLRIEFNGVFMGALWMFTDPLTKSTLAAPVNATLADVEGILATMRAKFGANLL